MEGEFAATPWNKILALQMTDKKMKSLGKIVVMNIGAESAEKRAKDKHSVGSKSGRNTVE